MSTYKFLYNLKKQEADTLTLEAQKDLTKLENILSHALSINYKTLDLWEMLKDNSMLKNTTEEHLKPQLPNKPKAPHRPKLPSKPETPSKPAEEKRYKEKMKIYRKKFKECEEQIIIYRRQFKEYEKQMKIYEGTFEERMKIYEKQFKEIRQTEYFSWKPEVTEYYCNRVLKELQYLASDEGYKLSNEFDYEIKFVVDYEKFKDGE